MAIPSAVKKQGEQAEEAQRQLQASQQEPAKEPGSQPGEGGQPATPDPNASGDPPAPEKSEQIDYKALYEEAGQKLETLKGKYSTLQGKYNSEVPRLAQQVQDLEATVRTLKEGKSTPPEPTDYDAKLLEEFGPETVKVMRAMVKAEVGKVSSEVSEVRKTQQESSESLYYRELDRLAPNWRKLNTDPDFLEWLNEPEGISKVQRGQNLDAANKRRDAGVVAAYFTAYEKAIQGGKKPESGLEAEVVPDTSGGSGGGEPPAEVKKTYTAAEVRRIYSEIASGQGIYRNNQKAAADMQRELENAAREGRIK